MSPGKKSHLYPRDPRAETALFVIYPQKKCRSDQN